MIPPLRIDDLAVRRGGRLVLDGVSLAVEAGEVVAVTGRNGAGKSTLLAAVAGLLPRCRGVIEVAGHPAGTAAARRSLAYLAEAAEPPEHLAGGEVVGLCEAVRGATLEPSVREALGVVELARRRLGAMTPGQRRRVGLAAALVGAPPLLVLDEPSAGLDLGGAEALVALVAARVAAGTAVLVASHDEPLLSAWSARRMALP